jgi:hypothetical protein
MGRGISDRSQQAVAQTVFLDSLLMGVEKSLFAAQKSFFDNSKAIGLHCKSKTRPSGSNSWICGRDASLRIGSEKNLNSLSEPPFPPSGGVPSPDYCSVSLREIWATAGQEMICVSETDYSEDNATV